MFTGIIQNQGIVTAKTKRGGQLRLSIKLHQKEKKPLAKGESIAVNGVCLTAAEVGRQSFAVDCVRETLEATHLGKLQAGDPVNLERALRMGEPFGGHFVTGHVDGIGKITAIKKNGKNKTLTIAAPPKILKFVFRKGSITVDGISLTVQSVQGSSFNAAIVPYTFLHTNVSKKKAGDSVNLEIDLIARYLKLLLR